MIVYLNGKKISLSPSKSIGKGGEADVFDIGSNLVVKLFKQPDHPDFLFQSDKVAARIRIEEHQKKLPAFPKGLPARVICPIDLATNKSGKKILGYSMKFLRGMNVLLKYSDKSFRTVVSDDTVIETFANLHETVRGIHSKGVVLGDFNDLNVLVNNGEAYIIDADSFQFGPYTCKVFTEKFVDPTLCDPNGTTPVLMMPHTESSDWYAFNVMLMQSLLFVGPFGGVYKPKDKAKRVKHTERPLKRITVFDSEVKYPKPATPYKTLSDDLLDHFHKVFKEDKRIEFPLSLLHNMKWKRLSKPYQAPAAVIETVRGNVTCSQVFRSPGIILAAAIHNDRIRYIHHHNNEFKREDGSTVVSGSLKQGMRFRIRGKETIVGDQGKAIILKPGYKPEKIAVDSFGNLPLFDSNSTNKYWIYDGRLNRDDAVGVKYIGDVLPNQTLFWVGDVFGLGFYRAGDLNVGFVFDAKRSGINDAVKIPRISGQLIDATCYFAGNWAWLMTSFKEKGKIINRCVIIKSNGTIHETFETQEGDGSWLSTIRGKCAAGQFLLSSTDDGIVRVEPNGGNLSVTKEFPDTEPFVDSGCHLYAGSKGLYVISRKEIKLLTIK